MEGKKFNLRIQFACIYEADQNELSHEIRLKFLSVSFISVNGHGSLEDHFLVTRIPWLN